MDDMFVKITAPLNDGGLQGLEKKTVLNVDEKLL